MRKLFTLLPILFICLVTRAHSFEKENAQAHNVGVQLSQVDSFKTLFSILSDATQKYSFQTLLTYEANGFITTFKLNHHVVNNTSYQQLMFMDGPPRHVMRKQGLLGCINGTARWSLWPSSLETNQTYQYEVKYRGQERVADRDALIFDVIPKDNYRYGYRYSVDKDTGLVLKLITFDKKAIIERMQTVSLDFPTEITEVTGTNSSSYVWRVPEVEPCLSQQFETTWQVGWLPKGFAFAGNRVTAKGEQVMIYTDGLVSLSVFMLNEEDRPLAKATAKHGATVVVMTKLPGHLKRGVAVVGEIPTATARRIAVSVYYD